MFLRRLLLSLYIPILLYSSHNTNSEPTQFDIATPSSWVKTHHPSLEELRIKPDQVNTQCLLIDTQNNWEEKSRYSHYAIKALTKSGAEGISQLYIDFDPTYQKVLFHNLRIFRNGEWLDKLDESRHQILQRETNLEQNLYNGALTLVYFLEDIRENDILDYSYTISGQHPLFTSRSIDLAYLQRNAPVEHIIHRILLHPDHPPLLQSYNTSIEPTIMDINTSLQEWTWEMFETQGYTYEHNEPEWHNPFPRVHISQYHSWQEVAQELIPLYALPEDFNEKASAEMNALVRKWKECTQNPSDRALLALRFVQDEIRYLGFEEGIEAYKPRDPNTVLKRRYGDCKDKTILLHALLQLMDIPSTPLLVNSDTGKLLAEYLPDPFVFNHVVLQVDIESNSYRVDPTIRLQGSSLSDTYFPDYTWGLLIHKETTALTEIPRIAPKRPTEIHSTVTFTSEDSADLSIVHMFYDAEADRVRHNYDATGIKKFSDDSLKEIQTYYGTASLKSPMQVSDDRENNIFTLTEAYSIPTREKSEKKSLELFSFALKHYFCSNLNPERHSPYAIYPSWVKEHIHIECPYTNHAVDEYKDAQKLDFFEYSLSSLNNGNLTDLHYEIKYPLDHIPQSNLNEYWHIADDLTQKSGYTLHLSSNDKTTPNEGEPLIEFLFIAIPAVLFVVIHKVKKTRRNASMM